MEDEIWKVINGCGCMYEISNYGRLRNRKTGKILKPNMNCRDPRYNLSFCGEKRIRFTRSLVAEAFLTRPNNYTQIINTDGNPKNNHVSNLKWIP